MEPSFTFKEVFEKHEKNVNKRFDALEKKIDALGEHEHRDYLKASVAYGLFVGIVFIGLAILGFVI